MHACSHCLSKSCRRGRLARAASCVVCRAASACRGYAGVEKLDDRLRSGLFQIQKREKEAARKREEEQRDELAKLGATRKK